MDSSVDNDSTVYVVDDDDALRQATARTLQAAGYRVQAFASPSDFLHNVDLNSPGCVLIDLRMPEMSGLDLQSRLAELTSCLPFVLITAYGDVPSTVRAMRQGAIDVLEKPYSRECLLDAVEAALAAGAALREQIGEEDRVAARLAMLTPREKQVLDRVLKGYLTKQIATELGVSPKTVEVHRSRIRTKLHVESITQLTRVMMVDSRRRKRQGEVVWIDEAVPSASLGGLETASSS